MAVVAAAEAGHSGRPGRGGAAAGREERREEEAGLGEPLGREKGEEAECFLAHSLPARLTHSAKEIPGPRPDSQATVDP
ncbi:hypothetical protein P7K49_000595, partial [Saguinus oedipus]